jgi:transcriptional regulator with XRE-family HTH domain
MTRQSLPDAEVPDPGRITSQQDFGRELTLARQQAGLTIREVAKASGIPVSTVGDYFAARHLPPARQPELLPGILAVCQIIEAEQVDRWLDALNRVRRAPGRPPAGPAPYRGLASYQPEDAAWFFGRGELDPALHRGGRAHRAEFRQVRQIRASARSSLVPAPPLSARTRSAAPARNPVVTSRSASPSSRSVPSSMSLPGTSTSPSV